MKSDYDDVDIVDAEKATKIEKKVKKDKKSKKSKKDKKEKKEKKEKKSKTEKKSKKDSKKKSKKDKKSSKKEEVESKPEEKETIDEIFGSKAKEAEPEAAVAPTRKRKREAVPSLFISGLPFEATPESVKEFLETNCGSVVDLRLPKFQDSGRLMGYGHVDFDSKGAFDSAVAMSGCDFMGRNINIAEAKAARGSRAMSTKQQRPENCSVLFVKNLPYSVTEDDVEEVFTEFGKVTNVRLARHSTTGRTKGFGYVTFENSAGVDVAMKNAETIRVEGRSCFIDYETGRPKGGFKTAEGRNWHKMNPSNTRGGRRF
eukprot:TRINITY_DN6010_c0_g1_i2.p1 TRINITY_DN6010_c0_g1~~TRINITY_DN6010_c0_g1_i2.p1  ORF type:complete len:326 (+),score=137.26 TRINITY_DN6010_c0_g1_i2:34-978(+)